MPRLPNIREPVLSQLEAELRHTPRETLLRDVERIEEMAPTIIDTVEYPEDWIVHRITGYRPALRAPRVVVGAALRADLTALCERLCALAALRADELASPRFLRARALMTLWGVSEVTLKRLRRNGLVTRRALNHRGAPEVWVDTRVAQAYLDARAAPPKPKPRRGQASVTRLQREAERYKQCLGWSLHRAAKRLAQRHGGSVEGIRQALLRGESRKQSGSFAVRTRSTMRRRMAMLRLWRVGIESAEIARIDTRPAPAVRREINIARATLLSRWCTQGDLQSELALSPRDEQAALDEAPDDRNSDPAPELTLHGAATLWRATAPCPRSLEHALARAFHASCSRVARIAADISTLHPSATALDEAETLLRRADQFRSRLLRSQLRLVLETCEARAGVAITRLPTSVAQRLVREALHASSHAIQQFDPARGGRLAGPVALAADRAASRVLRDLPPAATTATRRAETIAHAPDEFPARISVWSRWLDAPDSVQRALRDALVDEDCADLLRSRFGLSGERPRTIAELAHERRLSPAACARLVSRRLREASRAGVH
jgi:hypothetical protein